MRRSGWGRVSNAGDARSAGDGRRAPPPIPPLPRPASPRAPAARPACRPAECRARLNWNASGAPRSGMVIWPAISLTAANTGSRPSSSCTISLPMAVRLPLRHGVEQSFVGHRHVVEGHQRRARPAKPDLFHRRPGDFRHQFHALQHLRRRVGDLAAGAQVLGVAEHGAIARAGFHPDRVAARPSVAGPPRASAPPVGRTARAPG